MAHQLFDPYHRWLGIPPNEQPANHYRLLGVSLWESDLEVIRDAVAQRMAHVRTYQLGKHLALSQRILNELGVAKACLSDPQKKAEYDTQLRRRLAGTEESEPNTQVQPHVSDMAFEGSPPVSRQAWSEKEATVMAAFRSHWGGHRPLHLHRGVLASPWQ